MCVCVCVCVCHKFLCTSCCRADGKPPSLMMKLGMGKTVYVCVTELLLCIVRAPL